ncbi:MAG: molybdopterin-dependent oxidoreductase [Methylococcaceae bacterium]|nr:molybdopterin-dependent oxidoreductase [Methylococcaceae bacterium]
MSSLTTKTTCPYCGVGCGVLIERGSEAALQVRGDPEHPANFGRLCSKGSALGDTLGLDGRLLYPEIGGVRVGWDQALDELAGRFRRTIAEHGPDSVAFYVSGQLLTEDYYVANKLMKGFIGSGNIDTNSRLCMSSTVAGHKRAFGADIVPGCYEDLELADLIVLVGSNTAWCHPVLYRRIAGARERNANLKLVVIDPRRTAACESADLHLKLKPGSDVALFNGLLNYLRRHDGLDFAFLEKHVAGFADALAVAASASIPEVASACGLDETEVVRFFQLFTRTEKTVTAWSQGVNQSSSGTDKVNAIINVHLATGRIGRPGMGPFSLTGQPNAMGGREVGGLANQLAAHLDFDHPDHWQILSEFWKAPHLARRPGLKAVELFQAVAEGRIKALWIMATNPVVSLPDVNAVRGALARCEFVAVSDCEDSTDLKPYAHLRLPALAWGEKEGTVTNSERRISRQRSFLPIPGEARADWWIITEVARRMGYGEAFGYGGVHEIFREHARLSAFANEGRRLFDIGALAEVDLQAYDEIRPFQWPATARQPDGTKRLFGEGCFLHADGKARMIALSLRTPVNSVDADYPLALNTGRIRDQWHTMTRTARSPRLNRHLPEPYAELHPTDAARHGIRAGELVRLQSRWGEALARAQISQDQQTGTVFMPMHWSDSYASQALVNALVNPVADPLSGEPESKHTPIRISAYRPAWHGFLISRQPRRIEDAQWQVQVRGEDYWLYELAGETVPANWRDWAHALLPTESEEWLEYADPSQGRYRCVQLGEGRLTACLFVSANPELPARDWLAGLFAEPALNPRSRQGLLAGKPLSSEQTQGRIVCACFNVGYNTIDRAIRRQTCVTVEQIGAALRAGTNCGSCIPELKTMLAENSARKRSA